MEPSASPSYGRAMGILASIFGLFLGVGVILGALLLFRKKYERATGTVKRADCKRVSQKTGSYDCQLDISFKTVAGQEVSTSTVINSNTFYTTGQDIVIYYLVSKPEMIDIGEAVPGPRMIGWVLAIIGAIILLGSIWSLSYTARDSTLRLTTPRVAEPGPAPVPAPVAVAMPVAPVLAAASAPAVIAAAPVQIPEEAPVRVLPAMAGLEEEPPRAMPQLGGRKKRWNGRKK